jgi:hypothetical protein
MFFAFFQSILYMLKLAQHLKNAACLRAIGSDKSRGDRAQKQS